MLVVMYHYNMFIVSFPFREQVGTDVCTEQADVLKYCSTTVSLLTLSLITHLIL
jgi:hypothetical protein